MKKKVRTITVILIMVLVALTFISKSVYNTNLPRVYAVKADSGSVPLTHETTGTLEFPNAAITKAAGEWKVTEVLIREGDTVEEGDVLCRFDTRTYDIEQTGLRADRQRLWSELDELNKLPEDVRFAQVRDPYVLYAELNLIEKKLEYAESKVPPEEGLLAPAPGRVYGFTVKEGDIIAEGQTILSIITDNVAFLRFYLPASDGEIFMPGASVEAQVGMGMRIAETGEERFERIPFTGEVVSGVLREDEWECVAEVSIPSFASQPVAFQDIPVTVTHVGEMNNLIVPMDYIFEVDGFTAVYTIDQRNGLFGAEDFLRRVRVEVLYDNGQYAVLSMNDTMLQQSDVLASSPSEPIREGSVVWVENKE